MHFDDRLGTVLRLRASSGAVMRIQFRQLLDLLGTIPVDAHGEQIDAAFNRLGELSGKIPAQERAAMIADAGLRLRSPRLVAALTGGEPAIAAAALRAADLSADQWLDLIPALPPASRAYLRERRDLPPELGALLSRLGVNDRGLPPVQAEVQTAVEPESNAVKVEREAEGAAPAATADEPVALPVPEPENAAEPVTILPAQPVSGESGIGAIVKRIEAYRRGRQVIDQVPANDSPRLPLGEEHVLDVPADVRAFDFATDAEGRITWADPGVAPMVLGQRLESAAREAGFATLLRRHQPLKAQALTLEGAEAITGPWQLDAAPWFDPATGRFLGYRGRMRRPAKQEPLVPPVTESQADRIRQMLHELKNPVNAIQGYAELIQQQLYGPTPHEYRALAAGIAGDAARMLSAFDELERLARLDSGAMELDSGETDLAEVVRITVGQLGAHTAQRGSGFALKDEPAALPVPLARLEVERIAWRLLATLAGISAPGELLKLRLRPKDGVIRLDVALPASLAAREGDSLFDAAAGSMPQIIAAGVFGVGFALRLVRAEARAAGGDLLRRGGKLRLILPGSPSMGLTAGDADHTHADAGAPQG